MNFLYLVFTLRLAGFLRLLLYSIGVLFKHEYSCRNHSIPEKSNKTTEVCRTQQFDFIFIFQSPFRDIDRRNRRCANFVGKGRALRKAFEEIAAGLKEAVDHAQGFETKVVVHQAENVDVKKIRKHSGLTQQQFCATFGLSLGTLRHWEQGDRQPKGAAKILMKVVERSPQTVIEVVS